MHSVYLNIKRVVNVKFHATMLLRSNKQCRTAPGTIINQNKGLYVRWFINNKNNMSESGQVQGCVLERWVPGQQPGHQGKARPLIPLRPACNWLQGCRGPKPQSCTCFISFCKPISILVTSQGPLAELSDGFKSTYFQTFHVC